MTISQAPIQAVSVPAMDSATATGPSLDTYIEARFRLLDEKLALQMGAVFDVMKLEVAKLDEKLEATRLLREAMNHTISERFEATTKARETMYEMISARFEAVVKATDSTNIATQRAADKAEQAQQAHNASSNEWRSALNDFRFTLISRPEFERQVEDFAAYRLETSRVLAAMAAATSTNREVKDDGLSKWAIGAALLGVVVAILALILTRTHGIG